MRNKINELEIFLDENNLDFLCINEHWMLYDEISCISLKNYRLVSVFSRINAVHGGVAIYCLNKYNPTPIKDVNSLSIELHCEVAGITYNDIHILSVYRSPNGDFNLFLERLSLALDIVTKKNKKTIVTGDFNVHFNTNERNLNLLLNAFRSYGFHHVNTANTRNKSCLDNIFINFNCNFNCEILDPRLSDHQGVLLKIHESKPKAVYKRINYRPITDAGLYCLNNHLLNTNWNFINNNNINVGNKFYLFINQITSAVEQSFPVKTKLVNGTNIPKITWFNAELRRRRDTLHFLEDIYKQNPTTYLNSVIKSKRHQYRSELAKAKKEANSKFIASSKNPQKAMWRIINSNKNQTENKSDISPDEFNLHFANVAEKVINNLPVTDKTHNDFLDRGALRNNIQFCFREVTYIEVNDIITDLKKTNSSDAYFINMKILNAIRYIILIPLTNLINICIRTSSFPDILKLSKVIPLHKKDSIHDVENYRPISILPLFSKILETIIKIQLTQHFESNNLFSTSQFGFRAKLSTTLAINKLSEIISKGYEEGEYIHAQFLDLSKAFDCVSHDVLISKLGFYNFDISSINLIRSYLTKRYQYVTYQNINSGLLEMNHGVPQGSILGPILFLIYVNDLSNISSSTFVLFADDTTIINSHKNIETLYSKVNDTQSKAQNWFVANRLSLNQSKTETMVFSLRNVAEKENKDSIKFLGVYLDSKLSWEQHVNYVCKKISTKIYLLRNIANNVSQKVLITAYHGLIHSSLSYAILVWGHSNHCVRVFALQRRAIRIVYGLKYRDDCRDAFKKLSILTFPCTYILQCLLYIKQNPVKYSPQSDVHKYPTRNSSNICTNFLRLSKSRSGTNYYAIRFFNSLPIHIRELEFNLFKKTVRSFLTANAFYTFEEYFLSNFNNF